LEKWEDGRIQNALGGIKCYPNLTIFSVITIQTNHTRDLAALLKEKAKRRLRENLDSVSNEISKEQLVSKYIGKG